MCYRPLYDNICLINKLKDGVAILKYKLEWKNARHHVCNLNHRAPDTTRNNPPQNPPQIGRVFEGVSGREAGKDFSWSPEKAEIELVEIRAQGGSSFAEKKEVERTCKFSHKILEKKKGRHRDVRQSLCWGWQRRRSE
jgi:hypothetical protein